MKRQCTIENSWRLTLDAIEFSMSTTYIALYECLSRRRRLIDNMILPNAPRLMHYSAAPFRSALLHILPSYVMTCGY